MDMAVKDGPCYTRFSSIRPLTSYKMALPFCQSNLDPLIQALQRENIIFYFSLMLLQLYIAADSLPWMLFLKNSNNAKQTLVQRLNVRVEIIPHASIFL